MVIVRALPFAAFSIRLAPTLLQITERGGPVIDAPYVEPFDQATAVQVIDTIESLLTRLAAKRLDVGAVVGADGVLRSCPYVLRGRTTSVQVDEIMSSASHVPTVVARIDRLLKDLAVDALEARREALEQRRRVLPRMSAK